MIKKKLLKLSEMIVGHLSICNSTWTQRDCTSHVFKSSTDDTEIMLIISACTNAGFIFCCSDLWKWFEVTQHWPKPTMTLSVTQWSSYRKWWHNWLCNVQRKKNIVQICMTWSIICLCYISCHIHVACKWVWTFSCLLEEGMMVAWQPC